MNKNSVLKTLAELLEKNKQQIIDANKLDIAGASDLDESLLDRLKVDEKKVTAMIDSVNQTIQLEDPENKILYMHQHPSGMKIENKTVPFGKIIIIYESRPDVTIEAAITAFKAGNRVLLKGGKEARQTNKFLVNLWHKALSEHGWNKDYVVYLDLNRQETQQLIKENSYRADLIIPRGGEGLINFVLQNSNIPVIVSGRGNNFLYVDKDSDLDMAIKIILNGKKRISVCNALDKVLVNQKIPNVESFISDLTTKLTENKIALVNEPHNDTVMAEEFLAAKILLKKVNDIDEAIEMINRYSGGHSATIVTSNKERATKFLQEVDCAAVYHNASTRFTDGGQFGFGAEMAISTQKLHFRGPIALNQLVTNKWFIYGDGHIRE
ncbi:MAG: glutamate-5-semialdehyde dehydrogenase [Calditrichaeota bacterium]|nr:glutamate-5-semialdehyde dehydrogenase [Calditrichota bacterium]